MIRLSLRCFSGRIVGIAVPFAPTTKWLIHHRASLTAQLEETTKEHASLKKIKEEVIQSAEQSAWKCSLVGFFLLSAQFCVLLNWTFISFDWNLVEPITYLLGSGVVWMAVTLHFFTGRELTYESLYSMIRNRSKAALVEKGYSNERYGVVSHRKESLERALAELPSDCKGQ